MKQNFMRAGGKKILQKLNFVKLYCSFRKKVHILKVNVHNMVQYNENSISAFVTLCKLRDSYAELVISVTEITDH
jgi:hypothetical protein